LVTGAEVQVLDRAAYAVIFVAATSAAPHHHLNGIENFLSDGRSDSGLVLRRNRLPRWRRALIGTAQILDDH
jgi:hypothetical protein